MIDVRLELTEGAIRNIGNMEKRTGDIAKAYGVGSPEHLETLQSLLGAFATLLRLGGRVGPEDELSLVSAGPITFGLIFHAKPLGDDRDPLLGSWSCHS